MPTLLEHGLSQRDTFYTTQTKSRVRGLDARVKRTATTCATSTTSAWSWRYSRERVAPGRAANTMPSRKRGFEEMEADEPDQEPSLLDKVRNMWEFASLMQYIFFFGKAVKIDDDLDIEVRQHAA